MLSQRKFKKKLIVSQPIIMTTFACIALHTTVCATPNNVGVLQQDNLVSGIQAPLFINQGEIHQHLVQARDKLNQLPPVSTAKNTTNQPLLIETQPRSLLLDELVKKPVPSTTTESKQYRRQSAAMQQSVTTTASFTPLCPTLDVNVLYTLSGVQSGNSYCYHFAVTQKAKSTIGLTGQSSSTDFALMLLKDDGANNVSIVDTSDVIGNGNETIVTLTEPGNYYWYMVPYATDGTPINFVAAVNTQIDAYEVNDTLVQATALPDKFNTIVGNSDSTIDHDYYQFTAVRGQDVVIGLNGVTSGTSSRWITEISGNGNNWQILQNDAFAVVGSLQQNQILYVRVRPNTTAAWSGESQYRLQIGSRPMQGTHSVSGEYNLVRIPYSVFSTPYLTTQFSRKLNWRTNLLDSKGVVISEAKATLRIWPNLDVGQNYLDYEETTNTFGSISKMINFSNCLGSRNLIFLDSSSGQSYNWLTYFNVGAWQIHVPGGPDAGVGGMNVPAVTLGQICSMSIN